MNIILLLYEVNFELSVVLEVFYFFNIMLVLCQLILNLFYSINIMLQLYQGNLLLIFVPQHYPGAEQSILLTLSAFCTISCCITS